MCAAGGEVCALSFMQISSTNRSHRALWIHLLHVKPMRPMRLLPKGRFGRTPHGNQAHTTDYQSHTDRTSVSVFHMGAHRCAPDRTSLAHQCASGLTPVAVVLLQFPSATARQNCQLNFFIVSGVLNFERTTYRLFSSLKFSVFFIINH